MLKYRIADRWRPSPAAGRRRCEPTAAMRDDAGVIAIIVALSISTFLLGFAALAVDLGTAYERQSQLQSTADRLALAGAQGLPTIGDALQDLTNTLVGICRNSSDFDTRDSAGMCPDPNSANPAPPAWMRDGNQANGEVLFYQDTGQTALFADTNGDGKPDPVAAGQAEGIRVVLPPSKVTFGFAGAFSGGSTNVSKSATARVGTPLGAGILPFALTQGDLDNGQWCVKTGVNGVHTNPPNVSLGSPFLAQDTYVIDPNSDGQTIDFTIVGITGIRSITFYSEDSGSSLPAPTKVSEIPLVGTTYRVTMPSDAPGAYPAVWARGTYTGLFHHNAHFTTQLAHVQYRGVSAPNSDPCASTNASAALRGYSQLARSTDNPGSDDLTSNIRTGPQVREYADGGLAGAVGGLLNCVSTLFSPATTCLSNQIQPFGQDMTDGLFSSAGNAPGRLEQACPGTQLSGISNQAGAQMDDSELLSGSPQSPSTSLVDTSQTSPQYLLSWIINPLRPPLPSPHEGWITSKALQCGRLAVMPVISSVPLNVNGAVNDQSIVSFTYVWIDDIQDNGTTAGNRGVNWTGHQVSSLQGYVINPGLLPSTVAGSLVVGPYLGANMPKEALLVHDLGGPDA